MTALAYVRDAVIRRRPEDVFEFCSDLRHELAWNPSARTVEKLTDGPVGIGTLYRAQWANTGPTLVEVVRFDPPRTWETASRAMGMVIRARGTVEKIGGGSRYSVRLRLQPRGAAWFLAPFALVAMRRQEAGNMQRIKRALESGTARQ